ncbi:MAG TPA: hypothetical protein VGM90_40335 [Kofleriaceae bacterium]|jgi:hypothetical protein
MNPTCNIVAERVALGEPLGEHAEHATTCERCKRVVALTSTLAATHAVDAAQPGPGFSARMTVGAQRRLVVRRRNRVIASVGASALAAAAIAFVITRPPTTTTVSPVATNTEHKDSETVHLDDAELRLLVTDTDRAARASTDWHRITKPLHPYRNLVKGIK